MCCSVALPYTREAAMLLSKQVKSLKCNVDLKRRLFRDKQGDAQEMTLRVNCHKYSWLATE